MIVEIKNNSDEKLYMQMYEYLKNEILNGRLKSGERLPSLRQMAKNSGVSITTIRIAYDQLLTEGYITSRPQSGFYVAEGFNDLATQNAPMAGNLKQDEERPGGDRKKSSLKNTLIYDSESFDFVKWKKCMASVLNDTPERLLSEADRQGEPELRKEIAAYLYKSRAVKCSEEQVVISAGTQQIAHHLARILKLSGLGHISVEDPGYIPIRNIFSDYGFSISTVPVREDGVEIEKLPANIRTAAYVCPQNQFPTGALMPVARRRALLDWADANDSYVIEDDYNSELRYTGMPIPALQGLDTNDRTFYLGSFSSTLFPAIRISYMVLPMSMVNVYESIKMNYDQTCSKTEQLTLAAYMRKGYYQKNLRKIKKLYSRKLKHTLETLKERQEEWGFITAENSKSGSNLIIRVDSCRETICEGNPEDTRGEEIRMNLARSMQDAAASIGIRLQFIEQLGSGDQMYFAFYYSQIPIERLQDAILQMTDEFKSIITTGSADMPSVYEVIRLTNGKPEFLEDHYARLRKSLAALRIEVPFAFTELKRHIESLRDKSGIANYNIRLEVDISGHAFIHLNPTHYPDEHMYQEGVKVRTMRGERSNPNIKMADRRLRKRADDEIKTKDVFEVLLTDIDGRISEGSRSNVFFIKSRELYTAPEEGVLQGVTRNKVIEIAGTLGAVMHYDYVNQEDIKNYDAAFISGTSPKVLPISQIDNVKLDVNDVLMRTIMAEYDKLC